MSWSLGRLQSGAVADSARYLQPSLGLGAPRLGLLDRSWLFVRRVQLLAP